jgi:hypothetical protein
VPRSHTQEGLELVGGPRLLLDFGDGAQPLCVSNERDVAGHEPSTDGVGERAADHEMHLVDGLGRQPATPVARVQQAVIERLEMVWSQPSQRDASEGGKDVAHDVAVVAGVGAGGEHDPVAGKPLAGEVGTEAE